MARKTYRAETKTEGDSGTFTATIATFNTVDKDKDVTFPGAFPVGKEIVISAYGHGSWDGALPVGKGVLQADSTHGWVEGKFFTDTSAGADTYRTVKNLYPLGEWSYAYEPEKFVTSNDDLLKQYPGAQRGLLKMDVYEASPVLLGAGVGTSTTAIKALKAAAAAAATTDLPPDARATIAHIDLLVDQTDEMVDTLMDQLNIPDPDELADGEVEEAPAKSLTLSAHAHRALAGAKAYADREVSLAGIRAKEGRAISAARRERIANAIAAFRDASKELEALLEETAPAADDGKSLLLAFESTRANLRDLGIRI